jgi:hypothetical protein
VIEGLREIRHFRKLHEIDRRGQICEIVMDRNSIGEPESRVSSTTSSGNINLGNLIQNMRQNSSEQPRQLGSPAASLIQSAARSMLDDATPDTAVSAVSDDISERGSYADGNLGNLRKTAVSPTLASLRHTKKIPAIPDEQDRKRFIGCLAAILASAFEYDEQDPAATSSELAKGTFSYLDYTEDLYEDEEEGILQDSFEEFSSDNVPKRAQSFESVDSVSSQHSQRSHRQQGSLPDQRKKPRNTKEKAKVSAQRHRQRRYDILCQLLVSSSELLLLEKSVAKAFLPMLERVLVPRTRPSGVNNSPSSRPPLHGRFPDPATPAYSEERMQDPENPNASGRGRRISGDRIEEIDKDDVLRPFLESLSPGSGFRCLSLLILQYLLTSEVGYDARIRHVLKKVGVVVLLHDMELDPIERELLPGNGKPNSKAYQEMAAHAARKFESVEHSIARRLIRLSETNRDKKSNGGRGIADTGKNSDGGMTERIVRGVKIGSAGIVAGTLFALTGGLAAPGELFLSFPFLKSG